MTLTRKLAVLDHGFPESTRQGKLKDFIDFMNKREITVDVHVDQELFEEEIGKIQDYDGIIIHPGEYMHVLRWFLEDPRIQNKKRALATDGEGISMRKGILEVSYTNPKYVYNLFFPNH